MCVATVAEFVPSCATKRDSEVRGQVGRSVLGLLPCLEVGRPFKTVPGDVRRGWFSLECFPVASTSGFNVQSGERMLANLRGSAS